jgi:hypothetical protein
MRTVGAEAILSNVISLDPSRLDLERPAERRMVGFCYHFALLHCALLRATGTPARTRCGFAGYFDQSHDELDASLDVLSFLAATAESVETIKECFDLYPELQPPTDAVAR